MQKFGQIVVSKKGHDEGRVYVILNSPQKDFVMIADGNYRKLKNPKRKRIKHLVFKDTVAAEFDSDAKIVNAINQYKKSAS